MTVTDQLLRNARRFAAAFDENTLHASPFIPNKNVRGFVYEVENGRLREVS